jgi:hypothetical protein
VGGGGEQVRNIFIMYYRMGGKGGEGHWAGGP